MSGIGCKHGTVGFCTPCHDADVLGNWKRRALEAEARATQVSIELTEAEKERNAWQFKCEDLRRALDLYQEIKAANVAEMAKLRLDLALAKELTETETIARVVAMARKRAGKLRDLSGLSGEAYELEFFADAIERSERKVGEGAKR